MLWPCEEFAREHLPIVRAAVAKLLIEKYGLSQEEAAKRLGLTQAAVSKALSQYKQKIKKIQEDPKLFTVVHKMAEEIAKGEPDASTRTAHICESCERLVGKQKCKHSDAALQSAPEGYA